MLRRPTIGQLLAAGLDPAAVERVVQAALDEDLRYGPDVTSAATAPAGAEAVAAVVARQPGVLAGLPVAVAVLDLAGVSPESADPRRADGDRIAPGTEVLRIHAPLRELLGAERTLLNFLTHLSGVATATRAWADALAGTSCVVRDTRKTLPGLRVVEKYAVRCGGGQNHRMGLGDAALIKDNHVIAAGGITKAIEAVRAAAPGLPLGVECDTLPQVRESLDTGAELILLDSPACPAPARWPGTGGSPDPWCRASSAGSPGGSAPGPGSRSPGAARAGPVPRPPRSYRPGSRPAGTTSYAAGSGTGIPRPDETRRSRPG